MVETVEVFEGGEKMRYWKSFAHYTLAAGLALGGAMTLSAGNRDVRHDYRDLHRDYSHVNGLRADIARDRVRLNEDIRLGRQGAASRAAADLARDRRALRAELRDIHRDRQDIYRDRLYRNSWR
jgi:hypothetical protein